MTSSSNLDIRNPFDDPTNNIDSVSEEEEVNPPRHPPKLKRRTSTSTNSVSEGEPDNNEENHSDVNSVHGDVESEEISDRSAIEETQAEETTHGTPKAGHHRHHHTHKSIKINNDDQTPKLNNTENSPLSSNSITSKRSKRLSFSTHDESKKKGFF